MNKTSFQTTFEVVERLLQILIKDDNISLRINANFESNTSKEHKYQKQYEICYVDKPLYIIKISPYFACCGVSNISEISKTVHYMPFRYKNLSTEYNLAKLFVFMIILYEYCRSNVGIITLTTPCATKRSNSIEDLASYYQKSYHIAQKLLKALGGNEHIFDNHNTSNRVSHMVLSTSNLTIVRNLIFSINYENGKEMTSEIIEKNNNIFETIVGELKPLLNILKSK